MDVMFLLPLTMESFALEPVGIFLFYLTLLLRILEELRQKRPKNGHLMIKFYSRTPLYSQSKRVLTVEKLFSENVSQFSSSLLSGCSIYSFSKLIFS